MLRRITSHHIDAGPSEESPHLAQIDIERFLSAARRQASVVAICAGLGLLLGFVYTMTATPQYTAHTSILIDSQKDKNDLSATIGDLTLDSGAVDSQVEVLKSEKIAIGVINQMKLTRDPEFLGVRGSLLGQAMNWVKRLFDFHSYFVGREMSDEEFEALLQRVAINKLENDLDVRRVGHTYVLDVAFTSPNPNKAAQIANAFGEAYLTDKLDSKFDATRRASGWLQGRITELKQKALDSDAAVQKFKADKGLVTVGAHLGKDGDSQSESLVSDQQMTELNTQMMMAQSETAKADARVNQINELLTSGKLDSAVTDSLENPVITDLRQKYLRSLKLETELEAKLGPNHLQVISLKRDLDEYKKLIFDELHRISETYRSESAVAKAREDSLKSSMSKLVGASQLSNELLVQLRELEREADTYKTLYKTFLERYQETIQQQSFPITEARVITSASAPKVPSYPKSSLILALYLVLGCFAGGGLGAFRELRDRVFRTAAQAREDLGLDFLGMLPQVSQGYLTFNPQDGVPESKQLRLVDTLQRYSVDHPLSQFAETLRATKVAVDLALVDR